MVLNEEQKKYLETNYYDPRKAGAYGGFDKFYNAIVKRSQEINVGRADVKKWLSGQEPYSIHRGARRRFERDRVITSGMNIQADADLADTKRLAEFNSNTNFILVVIDVFSRYAWVRPLKDKSGKEMARVVNELFHDMEKTPYLLRTDNGMEFKNKLVQKVYGKYDVVHFTTRNEEIKANYAERFIRSLRKMMARYLERKRTRRYLDALQDLVYNYNHRPHRSLKGMTPAEVDKSNEAELWLTLYDDDHDRKTTKKTDGRHTPRPYKFKIGDQVRVVIAKTTFRKEYENTWSREVFTVVRRQRRNGVLPLYSLEDLAGEQITGTFYTRELQRVPRKSLERDLWRVESVLKTKRVKTRGKKGKTTKQVYVKWEGYPKKFNSWVNASDVEDVE